MKSKYHAQKCVLDGITFDSRKEARKYSFAGDTEERLKQAIDDMIRLGHFLGASWWEISN